MAGSTWCDNESSPTRELATACFETKTQVFLTKYVEHKYRWASLNARDRDSKNMLTYNEFAYKKTNNHCKLEDRFQKKGHFSIAYT